MPESATAKRPATKKTASASESKSSGSGSAKSVKHLVAALEKIAARVVFLSENDQRDVTDHLEAASAHAAGKSSDAKDATERINERNPDKPEFK